jgi:hypothetical protein
MVSEKIYDVLISLKEKTINKIRYNLNQSPEKLNIVKSEIKEINIYSTFEGTFSTCLGLKLQEVAAVCGKDVVNIDKEEKKTVGIDIRTSFGEGQMKLAKTTQTGTHKKDSLDKLIGTTQKNNTAPFFVTAISESYRYYKDGVLYIGGEDFWSSIGINYEDLCDTIRQVIRETYEEVQSTIIPSL